MAADDPKKRTIPNFATEAEEADWWYDNREKVADDFVKASAAGEVRILTKESLRKQLASPKARPVTIRLPEADIELARQQAARKGLPYQTYIRSILHETLAERRSTSKVT